MNIKLDKTLENFIIERIPYFWRNKYEKGEELKVIIKRDTLKQLKRWGNTAEIIIKNGNLLSNSLIENTWNWNEDEAAKEAANALNFIIYDRKVLNIEVIE